MHAVMENGSGNGHARAEARAAVEARVIEIDLSDLALPADVTRPDQLALATAHLYERFVPYADEGWEWVAFPGSRDFDGWIYSDRARVLAGARLLSRRLAPAQAARASHGVSVYRTRQLTGRPWTAEPGSKLWRSFT